MEPYSADDVKRRKDNFFIPERALEKVFKPLTSQFEISGTKYWLQFGTIESEWASVLLVDNKVISACVYKEDKLSKLCFPNIYNVVGWLSRTVVMPEFNTRDLLKLIKRLIDQLIDNRGRGIDVNYDVLLLNPYLFNDIERGNDNLFVPKKSSDKGFISLSSQLGLPGTSYRVQLGLINDKWAIRLLKGKDVIDSKVFKDADTSALGFPNQNLIAGWVLRTVAIPNINPHQLMKSTQALTKQAIENKKHHNLGNLDEYRTSHEELDKVPESETRRRDLRFPYPYIFKPPEPPDDIGVATNVQRNKPLSEEEPDVELFCKYCGSELAMDERYCSVCGKKS